MTELEAVNLRIEKAQRMLDSGVDNEFWERELQMITDERQWIIDGNKSL